MDILQEVGLTPRETQIYELLLKLGETSAGKLVAQSRAHPQVVHRTIASLQEKQLAVQFSRNGRKWVRAENPEQLLKREERRLRELRSTIPYLKSLQREQGGNVARLYKGNQAIRDLRLQAVKQMPTGSVIYILGGSDDRFFEVMGSDLVHVEKLRIQKKIHKKLLSFENQRKQIEKNDVYRKFTEYRYLPENYPALTSTTVHASGVEIFVWAAEPIILSVESPELSRSYGKFFNLLWKQAIS